MLLQELFCGKERSQVLDAVSSAVGSLSMLLDVRSTLARELVIV